MGKIGVLILDKEIRTRQVTKGAAFDNIKHIGFREIISDAKNAGHEVSYVSPESIHEIDYALFSVVSYYEVYNLIANFPKMPKNIGEKLILGGAGMSNAIPFRNHALAVCFGRGETLVPQIIEGKTLPNVWTNKDVDFSGKYEIGQVKKWVATEHMKDGEAPKGLSGFQESHIGCRKKCYFCQYTWKNQFTRDDERVGYKSGLNDCENTIAEIDWGKSGDRGNHNITAIDGATEKARKTVNRGNITNLKIIETLYRFFEQTTHEVCTLKLYCVVGYPFETKKDVDFSELMEIFARVDKSLPANEKRKLHIFITCTHFVPMPFTPMQGEPVNTLNVRSLLHEKKPQYVGKNIIAKIMSQVTSPAAAMEQAIFNRCKIGDEKYLKAITSPLYNKMDVTGKINWIKKNIPYRMYGKTDDVIHEYIGSPYELEAVVKAYRANVEKYYSDFRYENPVKTV
jgi:hypothetical protein